MFLVSGERFGRFLEVGVCLGIFGTWTEFLRFFTFSGVTLVLGFSGKRLW